MLTFIRTPCELPGKTSRGQPKDEWRESLFERDAIALLQLMFAHIPFVEVSL